MNKNEQVWTCPDLTLKEPLTSLAASQPRRSNVSVCVHHWSCILKTAFVWLQSLVFFSFNNIINRKWADRGMYLRFYTEEERFGQESKAVDASWFLDQKASKPKKDGEKGLASFFSVKKGRVCVPPFSIYFVDKEIESDPYIPSVDDNLIFSQPTIQYPLCQLIKPPRRSTIPGIFYWLSPAGERLSSRSPDEAPKTVAVAVILPPLPLGKCKQIRAKSGELRHTALYVIVTSGS